MAGAGARLPSFVVIGAMKSGTTSLYASLAAHPQIFCALEPHFFDDNFHRGLDWYRSHFEEARPDQVLGEKTPDYLHRPDAVERMATLIPDARLIAILRNPVDRAYSHYWHMRSGGLERLAFAEAIAAEPARLKRSRHDAMHAYMSRGHYLPQLQRVCERYPREQLLVLLFEDLVERPRESFAEICRFIGVPDDVTPPIAGRRANPHTEHRPLWLWRAMFRYRLWRWLPRRAAEPLGRWMTREVEYGPMDPDLRARLVERFREDNGALGGWLGRDLSAWNR